MLGDFVKAVDGIGKICTLKRQGLSSEKNMQASLSQEACIFFCLNTVTVSSIYYSAFNASTTFGNSIKCEAFTNTVSPSFSAERSSFVSSSLVKK